jgi:hypothetical protein
MESFQLAIYTGFPIITHTPGCAPSTASRQGAILLSDAALLLHLAPQLTLRLINAHFSSST